MQKIAQRGIIISPKTSEKGSDEEYGIIISDSDEENENNETKAKVEDNHDKKRFNFFDDQ